MLKLPKFQFWLIDKKAMVFAGSMEFHNGELAGIGGCQLINPESDIDVYGYHPYIAISGKPSFIVREHTGLEDKNGKEIYEGDVIKIHPEGDTREIVWLENEARFCSDEKNSGHDELMSNLWKQKVEVIGNIYENPELLKP